MLSIVETNCTIHHEGKSFSANGAWLTPEGGAVYIVNRSGIRGGNLTAETWNGDLISSNVQVISEWKRHSRYMGWYLMRSIRFTVAGNISFSGRYSPDSAQLCKVKRVKS